MRKSRFSYYFVEKSAFYSLHNAIYSIDFHFMWKKLSHTGFLFPTTHRLQDVFSDALYQLQLYTHGLPIPLWHNGTTYLF